MKLYRCECAMKHETVNARNSKCRGKLSPDQTDVSGERVKRVSVPCPMSHVLVHSPGPNTRSASEVLCANSLHRNRSHGINRKSRRETPSPRIATKNSFIRHCDKEKILCVAKTETNDRNRRRRERKKKTQPLKLIEN